LKELAVGNMASSLDAMDRTNRVVNRHRYILDTVNWGVDDFWETPLEFHLKNGDCEDYAIAKYKMLKLLGMPADKMRIVVLRDNNLRIYHAVLVVWIDGEPYLLDNQIRTVVSARSVNHYDPIFSINEHGWWRHSGRGKARP